MVDRIEIPKVIGRNPSKPNAVLLYLASVHKGHGEELPQNFNYWYKSTTVGASKRCVIVDLERLALNRVSFCFLFDVHFVFFFS